MKLKLHLEKSFAACVIAFDDTNRATPAYRALLEAVRPYKKSELHRVSERYAKEYNYFGYKVCEVCTIVITELS